MVNVKFSYGIILLKSNLKFKCSNIRIDIIKRNVIDYKNFSDIFSSKDDIEILMVKKKYTIGYSTFVTGNYEINKVDLYNIFDNMNLSEISNIKELTYNEIFHNFWYKDNTEENFKKYYKKYKKFTQSNLYKDVLNKKYSIDDKREWEFPKGRKKNYEENDLECAFREFKEETGISLDNKYIINEINPVIERIQGTDGKTYVYKYFICCIDYDLNFDIDNVELDDISFFNFKDALNIIKNKYIDRKKILTGLYAYLKEKYFNN